MFTQKINDIPIGSKRTLNILPLKLFSQGNILKEKRLMHLYHAFPFSFITNVSGRSESYISFRIQEKVSNVFLFMNSLTISAYIYTEPIGVV